VEPSEELLERLWQYCSISVMRTRGLHVCAFCESPHGGRFVGRHGTKILLGSAEIRVFSKGGSPALASPNLIYHYVSIHHYLPPGQFLEAIESGPRPPDPEYFEPLANAGLDWAVTLPSDGDRDIKRLGASGWEVVGKVPED